MNTILLLVALTLAVVSAVLFVVGLVLDRPGQLDKYDLRESTTRQSGNYEYTPVATPYDEVNEIGDSSLWHGEPLVSKNLMTPSGLRVYEGNTSLGALEGGFVPFDASKPMRVCLLYRYPDNIRERRGPLSLIEFIDSEKVTRAVLGVHLNLRNEFNVTWSLDNHHVHWVQPLFETDMDKTSSWVALELFLPCNEDETPAAYVNGYTCRLVSSDLDMLSDRQANRSVLNVDILRDTDLNYTDCSIQFVDGESRHGHYWTYAKTAFLHPILVYGPQDVVELPDGETIPKDNTLPVSRVGDIRMEAESSSSGFRFEKGTVSWPTQGGHSLQVTPHSGSILLRPALVGTPTVFETRAMSRAPSEPFVFSLQDKDELVYGSRAVFTLDSKWTCHKLKSTPGYKSSTVTDPLSASSFDETTGVLGATVLQDARRVSVDTVWASGETTRTVLKVPGRAPQRFDSKYYLCRGQGITLETFGIRDTMSVSQLPLGLELRGKQIVGAPRNIGVYRSVIQWENHPNQDVEFLIGDAFEVDYHGKQVTLAGRPVDDDILWHVDDVYDDLNMKNDYKTTSDLNFKSLIASLPESWPGTVSLRFVLSATGRQGLRGFDPVEYVVYYNKQRRYSSEVYGLHETASPKHPGPIRSWHADMSRVASNGFNSLPLSRVVVDEQTGSVRLADHIVWSDPGSDSNCVDVTVDGETIRFSSDAKTTTPSRSSSRQAARSLYVSRGDDIELDLKALGLTGRAAEALPDGLYAENNETLTGVVSDTATPGRYVLSFPSGSRMEIHVASPGSTRLKKGVTSKSPLITAALCTSVLGVTVLCASVLVG